MALGCEWVLGIVKSLCLNKQGEISQTCLCFALLVYPYLTPEQPHHIAEKSGISSNRFCSYSIHKLLTIQHIVVLSSRAKSLLFSCADAKALKIKYRRANLAELGHNASYLLGAKKKSTC